MVYAGDSTASEAVQSDADAVQLVGATQRVPETDSNERPLLPSSTGLCCSCGSAAGVVCCSALPLEAPQRGAAYRS